MSKAFTKETDDAPEDDVVSPLPSASLPPGTKNYLTAAGAQRFRAELEAMMRDEPDAETAKDDLSSEERYQRRRRKRRMVEIEHILRLAEIVPPLASVEERKEVIFGATVTVREVRSGEESQYQIVGVDEVDEGEDRVSLYAPIARALLKARVGQRVRFRSPAGEEELEIVKVEYERKDGPAP